MPRAWSSVVAGELSAVVEGDGLAPGRGQRTQQPGEGLWQLGWRLCLGAAPANSKREWRSCTVSTAWPVGAEEHQIGFPMPRRSGGREAVAGRSCQGPPVVR